MVGCGRTDTGVHARRYVCHFDVASVIPNERSDLDSFLYHANAMLPADIALVDLQPVADDAHARFDALEREYTYVISTSKDPFRVLTSWHYSVPLDVGAMNVAAARLLEHRDFTSFAKLGSDNRTNICDVGYAGWSEEGHILSFTIRADRFLRNMVRAIVGTLVDVGRGKLTVEQFETIIACRTLTSATAPAHGLTLSGVRY